MSATTDPALIAAKVKEWKAFPALTSTLAVYERRLAADVFKLRVEEAIRVDCRGFWKDDETRANYLRAIITGRINIGS